MATKFDTLSPFIAKLLAPLPADEEPVDNNKFRQELAREAALIWGAAMELVQLAAAIHTQCAITLRRMPASASPAKHAGAHYDRSGAFEALCNAEAAQCLIPAPTLKELRWKRRRLPHTLARPGVAEAIAADAVRLGSN